MTPQEALDRENITRVRAFVAGLEVGKVCDVVSPRPHSPSPHEPRLRKVTHIGEERRTDGSLWLVWRWEPQPLPEGVDCGYSGHRLEAAS